MKNKLLVLLPLILLVVLFSSLSEKQKTICGIEVSKNILKTLKSSGPPSCFAGEPPNNRSCTTPTCHDDGTVNTGTAKVIMDLDGAENGYIPNHIYTINISVSKPNMLRAGFQMIPILDSDITVTPGTIILMDSNRTQALNKNFSHNGGCGNYEKTWIEHTYAGVNVIDTGFNKWSFKWIAPASDVGTITFYLGALESNNDLSQKGDQAYTLKKTIALKTNVGVNKAEQKLIGNIYPNPASTELFIKINYEEVDAIILYNLMGKKISEWNKNDIQTIHDNLIKITLQNHQSGIYFLQLKNKNTQLLQKIIISN